MKQQLDLSPFRLNLPCSQNGEDGVVEKLFELMGITDGWLVDLGSWDGIYLSNTYYHLQKNTAFKTIQVEKEQERFSKLAENIPKLNCAEYFLINGEVQEGGANSLNEILQDCNADALALLSIDIDGEDLNIWNSLDTTKWRPAIVIIEEGGWQSEQALNELVNCFSFKSYSLVHVTGNFIFADNKYGIRATENIHQLIRKSGNPEYMRYFGEITTEQYQELIKELPGTDIHARLAGPQIVEYGVNSLCQKCNKNEAQAPHACPYASDVCSDNETMCNCCEGCEGDCCDDI